MLYAAAFLVVATGLAHSILGERYILMRLFHRTDIPHLFGGPEFTVRTLRFAWHLTSIAWWGLAAIIVLIARQEASASALLTVIGGICMLSGAVSAVVARFQHLSWLVFAVVGVLLLSVAYAGL